MRYIDKRNPEPKELSDYRQQTPGASYDSFPHKDIVRKSLLEEQGYICAYCMGRIRTTDDCSIEHYISQSRHASSPHPQEYHQKLSLLYSNMSAVCLNNGEYCDKKRGNIPLLILDPHSPMCERHISYSLGGEILPQGREIEKIKTDINTLGLNCYKLKKFRKEVWEDTLERFKQEHEKKSWSRDLFLEYSQKYRSKERKRGVFRFRAYCNFIAWCFEQYAEKYK